MLEIKGKFATAVCYAKVIEDEAVEQIKRMCDCEFTSGSRVRIMPDVHAGTGCTIGTTMTLTDKACPNVVGVDIGCGMYTVTLREKDPDLQKVDEAAHLIPSGMDVWPRPAAPFDLGKLRCQKQLKDPERLACSLGTLGGGNHFIEIDRSKDGTCYLVIHSGSRNLGKQTAEYYQRLAVQLHRGKKDLPREQAALVRTYREQGRERELPRALEELRAVYAAKTLPAPPELCWLYGEDFRDYLHDIAVCQLFARMSREIMAETILKTAGLTAADAFHTVHNYIDTDEMILRKGAIAAHKGEKVLIPVNMRDGSILGIGRGDEEWNRSAPHGAGRIMSRSKAKERISLEEYKKTMAGIYTTSVGEGTLDEAPMAYKSLEDIVDVIGSTVDIVEIMKPIYNFKASAVQSYRE